MEGDDLLEKDTGEEEECDNNCDNFFIVVPVRPRISVILLADYGILSLLR